MELSYRAYTPASSSNLIGSINFTGLLILIKTAKNSPDGYNIDR